MTCFISTCLIIASTSGYSAISSLKSNYLSSNRYKLYRVRRLDTLYKIAKKFRTSIQILQKTNKISGHIIYVGQLLRVPQKKVRRKYKPKKSSRKTTYIWHTVKKGDTLTKISRTHRISTIRLQKINKIKNKNNLHLGQLLLIPKTSLSFSSKKQKQLFARPVKGIVTSSVGYRLHPIFKQHLYHSGIDIKAPYGTPVRAALNGQVSFVGRKGGYGKLIILQHSKAQSTWYGHLSRYIVQKKNFVYKGEIIGYVGQTGIATGPHLHFEIRKQSKPQKILNRFWGLRGSIGDKW